jgi:hypothetical protein
LKIKIFDTVVIGSGPGGSITAALLAESGIHVALIEQGKSLSLSSCKPYSQEELIQKYKHSGITFALGNPKINYVEGFCAGGGSEINSGLYHRTPLHILDYWKNNYGVINLDNSKLESFFIKNELETCVSFMPKNLLPKASLLLEQGAINLGWKSIEVPRWVMYKKDGSSIKQSMSQTFLPRAISSGCSFYGETKILRIQRKNKRWLLKCINLHSSSSFEIESKNIFVCCGAIATAHILKKNNLSSEAGKSLKMHPSLKIIARFTEKVNDLNMGVPVHQVKEFSPDISLGCSISTPPYLHLGMKNIHNGHGLVQKYWESMAIYYAMTAEGSGAIRNIPFMNDPLITYNLGKNGVMNLINGFLRLGECLFEAGAIELYPVINNSYPIKNLAELRDFAKKITPERLNLMTIHLFSSCPMGENRDLCLADSYGKVYGQDGLYVNDASLLCTAPTVNPQGTIMMLSRRNTEQFIANH